MIKIFENSQFEIKTSFGSSVIEGSIAGSAQGLGQSLEFQFTRLQSNLNSVYVQIVPLSGQTGDFWETFFSNIVGGEPADQFALSNFVNTASGTFSINLNADNFAERKIETFSIKVFSSVLDPALGVSPHAETTFSVIDDDRSQFRNSGQAVIANFNQANGWATQDLYPRHIGDVNGDGFADVVGFGFSGVLVSFGSSNGNFSAANLVVSNFGQTAGWASDNLFHRELADVNGDGRDDILGFGFAGTLVSLARADGTFGDPATGIANFGTDQGWANQNNFARTVGDVNGDGKADIIGFGFAGTLVALGNGDGTFQPVQTGIANFGVAQGWTSDNNFHRAVADVNGDGRDDIVGFGIDGTLVALSNGNGTFAGAQLVLGDFGFRQGWASNDSFPRYVADVNGDDVADIVGFGSAGTLLAYGTGSGGFTAVGLDIANFGTAQGWSSSNQFYRDIADTNNDGLVDIIGFGIDGVIIAANQGDFVI